MYDKDDEIKNNMKNDKRFHRLMAAIEIATTNTPLKKVEDPYYRRAYRTIPGLSDYSYKRLKWHIVEWYESTTAFFAEQLKNVKKSVGKVPFLCCNYDLWTNQPTSNTFVGVHIFYVDQDFEKQSLCLGFKIYNPLQEDRQNIAKSDLLLRWLEYILRQYGLTVHDIHSSCTDRGSDVHRCLATLLPQKVKNASHDSPIFRDYINRPMYDSTQSSEEIEYNDSNFDLTQVMWAHCLPHLLNLALQETFGVKPEDGTENNAPCCRLVKKVQREIEHNRKSYKKKAEAKEIQYEEYEYVYATELRNVAPHRWKSLCDVLRRFLFLYIILHRIQQQHPEIKGSTFDYSRENNTQLLQYYSLLEPVNQIYRIIIVDYTYSNYNYN